MNVCIRCGKERKVSRRWKEKVEMGGRTVVWLHEETVCPDPECQKKVDKDLALRREVRATRQAASDERARLRKKGRKA